MPTFDATTRELDHRSRYGVDIRLLWNCESGRVWVDIEDQRSLERFEIEVEPSDALAAFRRPFAYAVRNTTERALAA
jgi:hypothetical protein